MCLNPRHWSQIGAWIVVLSGLMVAGPACSSWKSGSQKKSLVPLPEDPHSYSNPNQVRVRHVDLDLDVRFESRVLRGTATLALDRSEGQSPSGLDSVVLDTRDITIDQAEASADGGRFSPARFSLGTADAILGAPLTIPLEPSTRFVRVHYATTPKASAVQWVEPVQTAGKEHPFLFTQSQAIHARSWIPLQDSPGVRVTYTANIRVPSGLWAVMSAAGNPTSNVAPGNQDRTEFRFRMDHAVPPYLLALAVGDLRFQSMGKRTGVYAEPSMVQAAAWEFADTEKMIETSESIYGPYRWGRYDLLVLPPSFPFGGMENPMLTFATPTVIAGDRSLVSLVAHELAHSWSGNLVSNATWSDFWLNEGFTTYVERRIVEAVYGKERADMLAVLGWQELNELLNRLPPADQVLHINLNGRDPDEGMNELPYEKGALFLKQLEESAGRSAFDAFLRSYFDHFAFQSITTADFVEYVREYLPQAGAVPVQTWVYEPGMPPSAPTPHSEAFDRVEQGVRLWIEGFPLSQLKTETWSTQEWQHFLRSLPADLNLDQMHELDRAFHFTEEKNSEIAFQWLLMSIRRRYRPAYPKVEDFLVRIGRRKFVRPLFEELAKTPEGQRMALSIFEKARAGYHPITAASVEAVLK
ncbi:MAG: M1 family metallopeptidase [Acidobacteriota bacterium]